MPKALLNVTIKWLEGDALDALEPLLLERGWMALNKVLSRALVAYDSDGKIIAFEVFQAVPQVGPLFVEKEWRGSGIAEEMSDQMMSFLRDANARGFILVADSPFVAKIAEDHGMKKIESPVYIKIDMGSGV